MSGIETALAIAGTAASVAGTVVGASAQQEQGKAADRAAQMRAEALRRQGLEKQAASQREAITQERKTDLVLSRQQAVAAGSGGGATDPTVLDLMGDAAQQGAYNQAASLYEGDVAARGLREQAEIELFKGRQAKKAGQMAATSTILSGLSSFASSAAGRRGGKSFFDS